MFIQCSNSFKFPSFLKILKYIIKKTLLACVTVLLKIQIGIILKRKFAKAKYILKNNFVVVNTNLENIQKIEKLLANCSKNLHCDIKNATIIKHQHSYIYSE